MLWTTILISQANKGSQEQWCTKKQHLWGIPLCPLLQREGKGWGGPNWCPLRQQDHNYLQFRSSTGCFFILTALHPLSAAPCFRPPMPFSNANLHRCMKCSRIASCNTLPFAKEGAELISGTQHAVTYTAFSLALSLHWHLAHWSKQNVSWTS